MSLLTFIKSKEFCFFIIIDILIFSFLAFSAQYLISENISSLWRTIKENENIDYNDFDEKENYQVSILPSFLVFFWITLILFAFSIFGILYLLKYYKAKKNQEFSEIQKKHLDIFKKIEEKEDEEFVKCIDEEYNKYFSNIEEETFLEKWNRYATKFEEINKTKKNNSVFYNECLNECLDKESFCVKNIVESLFIYALNIGWLKKLLPELYLFTEYEIMKKGSDLIIFFLVNTFMRPLIKKLCSVLFVAFSKKALVEKMERNIDNIGEQEKNVDEKLQVIISHGFEKELTKIKSRSDNEEKILSTLLLEHLYHFVKLCIIVWPNNEEVDEG